MKNDLLGKYQNISNVLIEVKNYIGTESIGFDNFFMESLDYLIDKCLREMNSLSIYECKEKRK